MENLRFLGDFFQSPFTEPERASQDSPINTSGFLPMLECADSYFLIHEMSNVIMNWKVYSALKYCQNFSNND